MAGKNAGRRGGRWRVLVEQVRARRGPCCLCGQPIDYSLEWPDSRSFSVEHLKPRDTHPHLAEEPTNLGASHLGCNSSKGKRDADPGLGDTGGTW